MIYVFLRNESVGETLYMLKIKNFIDSGYKRSYSLLLKK